MTTPAAVAKGIIGRKVGMTHVFDEAGQAIPVTVIEAGPCHILKIRSTERDGYDAVQLGFLDKPRRLAARSERGQVGKISSKRAKLMQVKGKTVSDRADCEPKRFVREIRGGTEGMAVGQVLKVDSLEGITAVDVTGTSKGRGFAGAMKRHNFAGQRASHGVKKVHRHMGSTGALAAWRGGGRPKKGKCMPGHYGAERVTTRNLKVVRIDAENNLLIIRGAVPGPMGGTVLVRATNMV
jgi:large subunit ribosomal protein L3